MSSQVPFAHIEVWIENDPFPLSTWGAEAVACARTVSSDELEPIWFAPDEPNSVVCDVLETAGYATTRPYARLM